MRLYTTHSIHLGFFYFLPILGHRYFGASSFAAGIIVALLLFTLAASIGNKKIKIDPRLIIITTAFQLYLILSSLYSYWTYPNYDTKKSLITIFLFSPLIIYASQVTKDLNLSEFSKLSIFIIATQVLSIPFHYFNLIPFPISEKSSFLFNEPSHFALFIFPLAILFVLTSPKPKIKILYILSLISIALYYQNLTLILCITLCIFFLIHSSTKRKLSLNSFIFFIFFISFIYLIYLLQQDYILSRLTFEGSENASVLALLSAYERLYLTLSQETIWGVGIQGFGTNSPTGSHFASLETIDGRVNLNDGGVTIAKLASEMGVLLAPVLILILYSAHRSLHSRFITKTNNYLYICFSLGAFVELFLRGFGYYSINLILFTTFLLRLVLIKNRTSNTQYKSIEKVRILE